MSNTLESLRRLACHELGTTDDELGNDIAFADLGLDSLMVVDFMFAVEDRFHVQIDHDTAMKRPTLAGLAALIDTQLGTSAPSTGVSAALAA